MARLFGTNGIRGILGRGALTLQLVHDMSVALAGHFGGGPVLVGRDGRASSVPISRAVRAALSMAGVDCTDAGLVPTPCLQYAVKRLGYRGGIMVTASHNPPEYGGIKPVEADGVEPSRKAELEIEGRYFEIEGAPRGSASLSPGGAAGASPTPAAGPGHIRDGDGGEAVETYLDGIVSLVDAGAIRRRAPTVAIDAGNGAQAAVAPELCRRLGCRTVVVNGEIDPGFPGRGPEPTPENLGGLSRAVSESGADIGVAFDGDGDRSLFCDERGSVLTGDRSALLLAGRLLRGAPGSAVVTCLNSGSAIESAAAASGSRVVRTRVGSVEVSRAMVREGALAGFEENGGFMYGRHNQVRDGAMALALALDLLASLPAGAALSDEVRALPPSFTAKDKVAFASFGAAREAEAALAAASPGADTTDGVKMSLGGPDRWVMVRASGTEPILRVYAEGRSQEDLDSIMSEHVGRVRAMAGP